MHRTRGEGYIGDKTSNIKIYKNRLLNLGIENSWYLNKTATFNRYAKNQQNSPFELT